MIVAKPVLLAGLTTLAGFLSFCFTTVLPIREFGLFAGFGVIVSFAVALALIPALLIIMGPPKNNYSGSNSAAANKPAYVQDGFSAVIKRFFAGLAGHKTAVLFFAAAVVLISVLGTSRIIIDNVFIEYFKPDTDISKSDRFIREQFGGSKIVSVVAEADASEVLLNPACLLPMDNLSRHLETRIPEVGKTTGFTDLVKRINQVFNADETPLDYEGNDYYEIPSNPAKYGKTKPEDLTSIVSNYLILLSGNIDSYANDPLEPTAIKTTVQLRALGESDTKRAVEAIYSFAEDNFSDDVRITVGGSAMVESSLNRRVVDSQMISLLISLILVFLIIAVSNRSVIAGLIGIVPLSISILINFAVMGFFGIKLNLGTSMIASLVIGIGIDYTIHYMESFKRENFGSVLNNTITVVDFLERTFAVSGKAIIINALSVGSGFAVLIFSNFIMLRDFGLLVALTMLTSAFVSLTVIPALFLTFKPAFAFCVKGRKNADKFPINKEE
jgi:predicted RND superfamily exporter protein